MKMGCAPIYSIRGDRYYLGEIFKYDKFTFYFDMDPVDEVAGVSRCIDFIVTFDAHYIIVANGTAMYRNTRSLIIPESAVRELQRISNDRINTYLQIIFKQTRDLQIITATNTTQTKYATNAFSAFGF